MNKQLFYGVVLPILLVVTSIGIFAGMQAPEPPKVPLLGTDRASLLSAMPAADVDRVFALSSVSDHLNLTVSGTVVPFREINLAAEVAGRIISKSDKVRTGNTVEKGQELLRIDPRDYELTIERLEQRRDQELAMVTELNQEMDNTKKLLELAAEEYKLADAEVKRFEQLGSNFASAAELDQARRSRLASRNQQVTLQNQLRSQEIRVNRLEIAAKLAETELSQARLDLERCVVTAPVTGVIVKESVETDSFVQKGTALISVEDTSRAEVSCNLRMDQLYWLLDQSNQSADSKLNVRGTRASLPNAPALVRFRVTGRNSLVYEWTGKIDRFEGSGLDVASRTVPLRIVVENPRNATINGQPVQESSLGGPTSLVRGMFVDVVLQARPATQLLLVPKLGIKPSTEGNSIWKFTESDEALAAIKRMNRTGEATENVELKKVELNPDSWKPGFLEVIDNVNVIGEFNDRDLPDNSTIPALANAESGGNASDVRYWICEVPGQRLSPNDYVITTPLPGVEAATEIPLRVEAAQLTSK